MTHKPSAMKAKKYGMDFKEDFTMGLQLHETVYGKNFFEYQLPSLIKAINRMADALETQQRPSRKENSEGADKK